MKPLKVLLVEDEIHKKTRLLETIMANPALFEEPQVVGTTAAALEQLSSKRFDLLLADLILPRQLCGEATEENGVDLLESVQQFEGDRGAAYTVSISRADRISTETQKFFTGRPWELLRYRDDTSNCLENIISIAEYIQKKQAGEAERRPDVDVLIITALPEPEFVAVEQLLPSLGAVRPLDERQYYRVGELNVSGTQALSIAVAHCERMGPVHAAVSTSKLCYALTPKLVVMAGICAGYPKKTAIGDLVAAETSWLWQDGKFSVTDGGDSAFQESPHQVHVSPDVKACVLEMKRDENLWNAFGSMSRKVGVGIPKLVCGPVATGAAVLADGAVRDKIASTQHRAVVGLDMETYAVYVASASSPSVKNFVSLKAVCDGGDKEKADEHQAYAAYVSAMAALNFIRKFVSETGFSTRWDSPRAIV